MTVRTTVTLDEDAAVLLDEQPERTGSRYLSRLVVASHRRAHQALGYLAGTGWTRAEVEAACRALLGTALDHPAARSSVAIAGELADAHEAVRAAGVGDTWAARVEALRADACAGPALVDVAEAYWSGEARTVRAIDRGEWPWRGRR